MTFDIQTVLFEPDSLNYAIDFHNYPVSNFKSLVTAMFRIYIFYQGEFREVSNLFACNVDRCV